MKKEKIISQETSNPSKGFHDAFVMENKTLQARVYSAGGRDELLLKPKDFIRKRKGKKRGREAVAGSFRIVLDTENLGEIMGFQRVWNPETGMITAQTIYREKENLPVDTTAFAPAKKNILVYEMKAEQPILNVKIDWEGKGKETYLKYHIGGFFYTDTEEDEEGRKILLCVKAALYTNGYPKEGEDGLKIQNASRVAFYFLMDSVVVAEGVSETQAMLNLQMKMNRYLVEVEDTSFEIMKKMQL